MAWSMGDPVAPVPCLMLPLLGVVVVVLTCVTCVWTLVGGR